MVPRGVPAGLDAETSRRIERTFLAVRLVRGSLLLTFFAIAWIGARLDGWPPGVLAAIALATIVQAAVLVAWCRRYAKAGEGARRRG